MADQFHEIVSGDMDPIKKLGLKVPGFSGYIQRNAYRDADKLLRDTIADKFDQLYQRVSGLQRDFISRGEIEYVDDLESAATRLRTFAERVRRATRGYTGLFDAVKTNVEELTAVYQHDAALLDLGDEVGRAVDNVELSIGGDGMPAALSNLNRLTQQAIDTFNQRDDVMKGITIGNTGA
jgi:hypothetical protein